MPAQPVESVGDERGSEPVSLRFGPHREALHVPVDRGSPEERVADQSGVVVAARGRAVHPQVRLGVARVASRRPSPSRCQKSRTRPVGGEHRVALAPAGAPSPPRHLGQVREVVHEDVEPPVYREAGVDQREGGRGREPVGDHFPVAGRADPIEQAVDSGGTRRPPPAHGERRHVGPSVPVRDPHDAAAISDRLRLHETRQRSDATAARRGPATLLRCSSSRPIRASPSTIPAAGTPSARPGCRPSCRAGGGRTRRGGRVPARRATRAELGAGPPGAYLDALEAFCAGGGGSLDADTAASAASWDAALLAAGAGLAAIEALEPARAPPRSAPSARPATTPPRRTRWASACSTTSRSPRPRSRPGRAGAHRRLGRPPRQRHPGHLLDRPRRPLRLVARVAALSGHRPARRDRRRARASAHGQLPVPGGHDGRRLPRRARRGGRAARRAVRARPGCWSRPASTPTAPTRSPASGSSRATSPTSPPGCIDSAPAGRTVVFLEGGYDLEALRDSVAAPASALVGGSRRPEPATAGGPGRGSCGPCTTSTTRDALAGLGRRSVDSRSERSRLPCRSDQCQGGSRSVLDLDELLKYAVERRASDVHIKVGSPPFIRIDGRLERTDYDAGLARRDRAHRVLDHAEATRRRVHRVERGRLRLLRRGPRPLPRERATPARLGRARVPQGAERDRRLRSARPAARVPPPRRAPARPRPRDRSDRFRARRRRSPR